MTIATANHDTIQARRIFNENLKTATGRQRAAALQRIEILIGELKTAFDQVGQTTGDATADTAIAAIIAAL